ncbi:uncharacterized protein PV07_05146 [Cladophialophora immunda]|uniref:Uncharacterized protein n=1 Tax=Cladophialophora immunda TaxID=569365 RepID=A0A0D2AVM2_9EURO|nr:uncharacterized protein PV07_05146 [Cladophialophora immunda]KIW29322.1 hypothetical protein PV07_05146 [Cladophialophora immunda]
MSSLRKRPALPAGIIETGPQLIWMDLATHSRSTHFSRRAKAIRPQHAQYFPTYMLMNSSSLHHRVCGTCHTKLECKGILTKKAHASTRRAKKNPEKRQISPKTERVSKTSSTFRFSFLRLNLFEVRGRELAALIKTEHGIKTEVKQKVT